jgi:hypothetical protein
MSQNTLPILIKMVRNKFNYLFDEYGFKLIESEELRRSFSYCLAAESNVCRILFIYEANWDILFAESGKIYDGSLSGWIPINNMFKYFLNDTPFGSPKTRNKVINEGSYHVQRLEELSSELQKIISEVLDAFNTPETVFELQVM